MTLYDIPPHIKGYRTLTHRIAASPSSLPNTLQLKPSASTPQKHNTMSTSAVQGPGILFVCSRISPSANDILSESTLLAWYDNEHIPEVVSTSGIDSALRFIDIHKSSPIGNEQNPKPFLACYPMEDLAFTLGDEFKKIGFKSSALPCSGVIYDLADMDVSYLGIVGKTPKRRDGEGGRPKHVITSGIRPKKQPAEEQVAVFFQKVCKPRTTPVSILCRLDTDINILANLNARKVTAVYANTALQTPLREDECAVSCSQGLADDR